MLWSWLWNMHWAKKCHFCGNVCLWIKVLINSVCHFTYFLRVLNLLACWDHGIYHWCYLKFLVVPAHGHSREFKSLNTENKIRKRSVCTILSIKFLFVMNVQQTNYLYIQQMKKRNCQDVVTNGQLTNYIGLLTYTAMSRHGLPLSNLIVWNSNAQNTI